MTTLLTRERGTYDEMWSLEAYAAHSPGEHHVPLFLDMTQTQMRMSVLDAGCGSGKGGLALVAAGFDSVTLCDLTPAGLVPEAQALPFVETTIWSNLARQVGFHDWVYCTDVLEHIPTPFTMLAVQRLLDVSRRGVFLSISLQPDQFGVWVGKSLHHTVQSYLAWREQLATLAPIRESRDLLHTGVYLLQSGPC